MHGVNSVPCKSQKSSKKSLGSRHRKHPFTLLAGEGDPKRHPEPYRSLPLSLIVSKSLKVKRILLLESPYTAPHTT